MVFRESDARVIIDGQLGEAGWRVVDYGWAVAMGQVGMKGLAVAIREYPLEDGFADYLLAIDGEAVGVVEAKKVGVTLSGVREQSAMYLASAPKDAEVVRFRRSPLPFSYEATGNEIAFTNGLDPDAVAREVFYFHQPKRLWYWMTQAPKGVLKTETDLLRARVRKMPELLRVTLRDCQHEAILALEGSLAENRPRALIQMATGSGKTYTTVSSVYRLLRYGNAERILFLVDRNNLADQTLKEFQGYVTPDDGRKFPELYNVQHLKGGQLDNTANVCIATIQSLYAMLTNKPIEDEKVEEGSLFEQEEHEEESAPREIQYNPRVPIEYFDVIFIDECHRSIYSEWKPVLTYFDAFLVGLTATPEQRAFAFFQKNLVMEYTQEQSVADGVNVDYEVYRIDTKITKEGSKLEKGTMVYKRNKQTRKKTYDKLEDTLEYTGQQVDRDVVTDDQIRTILMTYRDALFTELFPGRKEVPKTLIFAKSDSHAEDIIRIARQVFPRGGNDFIKKITYRVSGVKPEDLIRDFRSSYYPRIAVTVDMISTGTDIKPLEVLIFMRSIKSRTFYEQMKGRGCRIIDTVDFQSVTPDAKIKTHFVLVDAIGVTDGLKTESPPLERRKGVSLEKLLEAVAQGRYSDDELKSLALRLGRLQKYVGATDAIRIEELTGGTLQEITRSLLGATDTDKHITRAQENTGSDNPDLQAIEVAEQQLKSEAVQPFRKKEFCKLLVELEGRESQIIDDLSVDTVTYKGFSEERARQTITSFYAFIEKHKDQIDALILAEKKAKNIDFVRVVEELAEEIKAPQFGLTTDVLWRAYHRLEATRVRGTRTERRLADIIALIRYTIDRERDNSAVLEPYRETVNRRFRQWLTEQERLRAQPFSEEQMWWLENIREVIAEDLSITSKDLKQMNRFKTTPFKKKVGLIGAAEAFGGMQELQTLLQQLNERLVA